MQTKLVIHPSISGPTTFGIFQIENFEELYDKLIDVGVSPDEVMVCHVGESALKVFSDNKLQVGKLDYDIYRSHLLLDVEGSLTDSGMCQALAQWEFISSSIPKDWQTFIAREIHIPAKESGKIAYLLNRYLNNKNLHKVCMSDKWFSIQGSGYPPFDVPVYVTNDEGHVLPCAVELTQFNISHGKCWEYPIGDFEHIKLEKVTHYKYLVGPNGLL